MSGEQVSLRLDADLLARAEALAEAVGGDPRLKTWASAPTRSAVLRLALARGLEVLEAEYKPRKGGKR